MPLLLFVTAAMICGGLIMYPIGWDNREVRESCGKGANVYNLGEYEKSSPSFDLWLFSRQMLLFGNAPQDEGQSSRDGVDSCAPDAGASYRSNSITN